MAIDWENFLDPYIQAVGELKSNCVGFVSNIVSKKHSPIEFVTGRVKPIESIRERWSEEIFLKKIWLQDMQDIAGLRIMVQFVDDVDEIPRGSETTAGYARGPRARLYPPQEIKLATGVTTSWSSTRLIPLMEMKRS